MSDCGLFPENGSGLNYQTTKKKKKYSISW